MAKNVADVYPLTPVQEGLLFHTVQSPDSGAYIEQLTCRITGQFEPVNWRLAWEATVAAHPALRTLFTWDGRKQPLQIVREHVALPWIAEDWRCQDRNLEARLHANRTTQFVLEKAPLMQFTLLRLDDAAWQFIWDQHHLVLDGTSVNIVLKEAVERYAAFCEQRTPNVTPPRPYRDFVAFTKQHGALDRTFWSTYLADFAEPILLGELVGQHANASERIKITRLISAEMSQQLTTLAQSAQVTLNHILQAAWGYLLHRYANRNDIIFGSVTAGRPPTLAGSDAMVGLFLNTLPLRIILDPKQTLRSLLSSVRNAAAEIANHEQASLAEIQQETGHTALFDSLIVFQNFSQGGYVRGFSLANAEVSEFRNHEYTNYPLTLMIAPGEQLEYILRADPAIFSSGSIQAIADTFAAILTAFANHADTSLATLPVQFDNAQPVANTPTVSASITADSLIAQHLADAPAITQGNHTIQYGGLNERADRLAQQLIAFGVRPKDRVAIALPRSIEQIVAMIGVLRAGAAYVPIDPTYPRERRAFIAQDAAVTLTLDAQTLAQLPQPIGELPEANSDRLAYLIYTSGSTGQPKGVPVAHHNLVYSTLARHDVYGKFDGRFMLLSSFSFDSSVVGIYRSLIDGGTLVLPLPDEERDPATIAQRIEQHAVTELLCLPSLWRVVLESASVEQLTSLKTVIVAGEACSAELIHTHYTALPSVTLYNEYGPTEGTVWASSYRIDPADQQVPIGTALPNSSLHVVDSQLRAVPPGAPGELLIAGPGVVGRYWQRDALSAERFPTWHGKTVYRTGDLVRRRDDGNLLFLGRIDAQIKIRGHRVEPLEIEQILSRHPALTETAVVAQQTDNEVRLIAHVVGQDEGLKRWLREKAPAHMMPAAFVTHTALPTMPNGKLDRQALQAWQIDATNDGGLTEPTTETEQMIVVIWQELLKVNQIGVESDFFALGGHSLLIMRLMARLRKQFALELPIDLPFRAPTLGELAQAIDAERETREEFEF